ncbi:MAG: hypothetical protein M3Y05_13030 [Gemmatimonadota bacterium]|nr:hypothetical protein [Gemmatimonadota bacterium]
MTRALGVALAVTIACACRAPEKTHADSAAAPPAAESVDTTTSAVRPTPAPAPEPALATPAATNRSPWAVTDSGAGVLRIGMTRDQLALDLHAPVPKHTRADSGCAYLAIAGIPPGMRTMWVAATLARIDIGDKKLQTDRGAKIGDKQAKIETLYRGRLSAMPAKYDPHGKYLVVRPAPPADSSRRIVFETDSSTKVTRYRVGREPEVEWVEGCG